MGLFKKKVYLTRSQEQRFFLLSQHYHVPYTVFVEKALEQYLDRELRAIRPEPPRVPNEPQRAHPSIPPMPPIPPKTREVTEGGK